jgi:hypothetical protein
VTLAGELPVTFGELLVVVISGASGDASSVVVVAGRIADA